MVLFKKWFWRLLIIIIVAMLFTTYWCNKKVSLYSKGKLYSDTNLIGYNKIGLLLGTSKFLSNGNINQYYSFRIDAAIKLYNAEKIKYLIISGDNGRKEYSEPEMMRIDLINAGIDSNAIYLDYAGFRTFDSIKRLKEIFGQNSATVISQQFHNERAIYIAKQEGINAIGFNAKDVNKRSGFKTQLREKLARVKLFADYWLGTKPKFLGKKVIIPS